MQEINEYLLKREKLIEKLENAKKKFLELEKFDVEIKNHIYKIDEQIEKIKNDKISIVLIGAYSDGKTSVIAGWLNEKMEDMKIDVDESSDEIKCYMPKNLPAGCEIVDTPGLFGNKKNENEKLSNITKKYISSATYVLYIVDAVNPIKSSHLSFIKWLFNDLDKLSSTIFVINKMDQVADISDEDDFEKNANIKKDNLRNKLLEAGISEDEVKKVKIICIDADPNGEGIEQWKDCYDEYIKYSRIQNLENATEELLQSSNKAILLKTGYDVLNDKFICVKKNLNEQLVDLENQLPLMSDMLSDKKSELERLMQDIDIKRKEIKVKLKNLEQDTINKIRSATMDTFKQVMEDNIGLVKGKEGYVLNDRINDIIKLNFESNEDLIKTLSGQFVTEDEKNPIFDLVVKNGAEKLKLVNLIKFDSWKDAIFGGRDLLGKIGVVIEFKPWEVCKMANMVTIVVPATNAAIRVIAEVVSDVNKITRSREFENNREEVLDGIRRLFIDIYDKINDDEYYYKNMVPDNGLKEYIKIYEKILNEINEKIEKINNWNNSIIDADFKEI